ncbi:MAG: V-type ATP synthase subunit E [Clostridia bacterium]|nr:V-type ATP synthase subunit E [Clostridia bacterium]
MAGIENITAIIKQDADEQARQIISDANAKAAEMIKEAEAEGDAKASALEKAGTEKQSAAVERAKSSADLDRRRSLLKAKQEIIADVIAKAKESLAGLDDKAYFETLIKLVKKYSTQDEGKIVMNAKDLARVPADFEKKANEVSKGKLTLSKEPVKINNGFLLLYDGIDINCTFDSLFEDNSEALLDKVSGIIF